MLSVNSILNLAEERRTAVTAFAVSLIALVAFVDYVVASNAGAGFLYLFPISLISLAQPRWCIALCALACSLMREQFASFAWDPDWSIRLLSVGGAFLFGGGFTGEVAKNRRLVLCHLEEVQAQVRLRRRSEQLLQLVVDTTPLAVFVIDPDGIILMNNRSAERLLGTPSPLAGRSVEPFIPTLHLAATEGGRSSLRSMLECRGRREDGTVMLAQVWCCKCDVDGENLLAAAVWDHTDVVRDREEAQLQSFASLARMVVTAVSHEVRNLAAAASAASHRLLADPRLAATPDVHALSAVLAALHQLATSGLHPARERAAASADIGDVLENARLMLEPVLQEQRIELQVEYSKHLPTVLANPEHLLQVLLNLGSNAARAVLSREGTRWVRFDALPKAGAVEIRCTDNGPGVTDPSRLFRAFASDSSSTGLGLFVCRALLHGFDGDIGYENTGSGACFVITVRTASVPAQQHA